MYSELDESSYCITASLSATKRRRCESFTYKWSSPCFSFPSDVRGGVSWQRKIICSGASSSSLEIHFTILAAMSLPFPPRELYYDGQVRPASSGKTFRTVNPATATPLADIQVASNADIDAAIAAGERAFPSWSQTPPIVRARILQKAALLLRERNDEIARVETLDCGKAFSETSTVDVVTGADVLEYYANLIGGGGLNGETTQLREDAWVYTKKAPLGVCAGIGAWNYPIQM